MYKVVIRAKNTLSNRERSFLDHLKRVVSHLIIEQQMNHQVLDLHLLDRIHGINLYKHYYYKNL